MYLLDTDILVGFLRKNQDAISAVGSLRSHGMNTSSITLHELFDGAFRAHNREKALSGVIALTNSMSVLDFDTECSRFSGKIKAESILSGSYPGEIDVLIAAVALRNNLKLVTRNKKNFEKIRGLAIKIW